MKARVSLLLALLIALSASFVVAGGEAGAAKREVFKGRTAQKFKIQVSVRGKQITLVRLKVKMRCIDGGVLFGDLSDFQHTRLRRDGRFADIQFGATDVVRWRGRLRGRIIRGMLRVKDKVRGNVPCDSGQVGFAVRKA